MLRDLALELDAREQARRDRASTRLLQASIALFTMSRSGSSPPAPSTRAGATSSASSRSRSTWWPPGARGSGACTSSRSRSAACGCAASSTTSRFSNNTWRPPWPRRTRVARTTPSAAGSSRSSRPALRKYTVLRGLADSYLHTEKFLPAHARAPAEKRPHRQSEPQPRRARVRARANLRKAAMFRDLYAVARHTPLHLIITPNGEQLKIIVTPKPSGDAADNPALAKPFSAIGTPEELDREFPEALRSTPARERAAHLARPAARRARGGEEKGHRQGREEGREETPGGGRGQAPQRRGEEGRRDARRQGRGGAQGRGSARRKESADAKAAKKAAKAAPAGHPAARRDAPAAASDRLAARPASAKPAAGRRGMKHLAGLPGQESASATTSS
jgi:PRTRC genetic system protein E